MNQLFFSSLQEIPNNGQLYNITISVTPDVNEGDYYLVLTDENLRILKQDKVAIIGGTDILDVNAEGHHSISILKESGNILCVETKKTDEIGVFFFRWSDCFFRLCKWNNPPIFTSWSLFY